MLFSFFLKDQVISFFQAMLMNHYQYIRNILIFIYLLVKYVRNDQFPEILKHINILLRGDPTGKPNAGLEKVLSKDK